MVVVSLSREALKVPESLKLIALAQVYSILEESFLQGSVSAARVESIAFDADTLRVNTDVRITPALTNVVFDQRIGEWNAA